MDLDLAQLRALDAVVGTGTFDAAARALHVTPSAVSQRIRALEAAVGRVLVLRTKPAQVTDSGRSVLRLAREVGLLVADLAAELGPAADGAAGGDPAGAARRPALPVAVNADSLATWVLPALAPLAAGSSLDLHRADQEHTGALLRAGVVMAAVTADAEPVPGCRVSRLGRMRYRAMAAPEVARRWFPDGLGGASLAAAPVVVFDRDDDLQDALLRRHGVTPHPPRHHVPGSAEFLAAVELGWGWGLLPDLQSAAAERAGRLVDLEPGAVTDVVLYWQRWKLSTPSLERLTEAVAAAARAALLP